MPVQYIIDAIACYKKVSAGEYLAMADEGIKMMLEDGRINQAARMRKEVAEMYEQQYELEMATQEYEKAAELYEMEESISFANQCSVKAADIMVMLKDVNFEKVITIYEKVVNEYMKKDLLKASAKGLVLKVWLCFLANDDLVGAKNRYESFSVEDPAFGHSREGDLLSNIFTARELNDVDMFEKTLHEYNRITPFDKVVTQILVTVKDLFTGLGHVDLTGNDDGGEPDLT